MNSRSFSFPHHSKPNIAETEKAVVKAHNDLLSTGASISAWSVSQAAVSSLNLKSWDSLGFPMDQVTSLYCLFVIEGKVNAFIRCYVGARRITTLYDLNVAICENECVVKFEEFKLGPLIKHPLIRQYFKVPEDVKEIYKITSEDIVAYLIEFMDSSCQGEEGDIQAEELLEFIANKESVAVKEALGVRIQSLRMYIYAIQDARKAEEFKLKNHVQKLLQKSKENREAPEESQKHPTLSLKTVSDTQFNAMLQNREVLEESQKHSSLSQKDVVDKQFNAISQHTKSSALVHVDLKGKQIRYASSSSETEDDDYEVDDMDEDVVSNYSRSGGIRNFFNQSSNVSFPRKLIKTEKSKVNKAEDFMFTNDMMEKFITTWKTTCRGHAVNEVLERMLNFYNYKKTDWRTEKVEEVRQKVKKMKKLCSLYPLVGLIHVAVASMKSGMCDTLTKNIQAIAQEGHIPPSSASAHFARTGV